MCDGGDIFPATKGKFSEILNWTLSWCLGTFFTHLLNIYFYVLIIYCCWFHFPICKLIPILYLGQYSLFSLAVCDDAFCHSRVTFPTYTDSFLPPPSNILFRSQQLFWSIFISANYDKGLRDKKLNMLLHSSFKIF